MSTSLCRAAFLTTAAPSARGAVRRFPAGRRAPGAAAFFRGVGFITLSTTMAPPPKAKVTMAWPEEGDSDDSDSDELPEGVDPDATFGDYEDDFDVFYDALSAQTEEARSSSLYLIPLKLSEEERNLQDKLKEIAERCMDLQADAMRRLTPEQLRSLYLPFRTVHYALTSVKIKATEGHANWAVSSLLIVHKLDVVRKMVSSASGVPLPLDRDKKEYSLLLPHHVEAAIAGLGGVDSNSLPEVAFALIEYTYNAVKSDIDEMIPVAGCAQAPKLEVTKLACANEGSAETEWPEGVGPDEIAKQDSAHENNVLVWRLEFLRTHMDDPMDPSEQLTLTAQEAELLSALRKVAMRGFDLVKDVSELTRPDPETHLFQDLFVLGLDFLAMGRVAFTPMGGMARLHVARLDGVRRVVSAVCGTPLPQTGIIYNPEPEKDEDDTLEKEIVMTVQTFCTIVELDVKTMLSSKYS